MLKQLRDLVNQRRVEPVPFNTSQFNDELADRVRWDPVKSGGTNMRTHQLVIEEPFVAKFRATIGYLIFCCIFLLIGVGIIGGVLYSMYNKGKLTDTGSLIRIVMPLGFGSIFTLTGLFTLYGALSPIRFDKQTGDFRKGRKAANTMGAHETDAESGLVKLNTIHALQLIKERCRTKNSTYYSYELNLVLESGQRINVVDHGGLNRIPEDANQLSQFLCIPVWDAT